MRTMLKLALAFLLIAGVAQAEGLTKNLTWNAVTLNVDNTPGVVDNYILYRSTNGGTSFIPLVTVPGTVTTAVDANVPVGAICYIVTASNTQGESAASNRLCFQVPSAKPQPPLNLR